MPRSPGSRAALSIGALLVAVPLAGCRYEPIGWWDIRSLSVDVEGGDSVEIDEVGFIQFASHGGDYTTYLIRYDIIPNPEGSVSVYPKSDLTPLGGNWEMDGAQDLSVRIAIGESGVGLVTDHTKGSHLTLTSGDPLLLNVPSTWTGAEAGTGASVTADLTLELAR